MSTINNILAAIEASTGRLTARRDPVAPGHSSVDVEFEDRGDVIVDEFKGSIRMRVLDDCGMLDGTIMDLTPTQVAQRISDLGQVSKVYAFCKVEEMVSDDRHELRPHQASLLEVIKLHASTLGQPLSMGGEFDLFTHLSTLKLAFKGLRVLWSQKDVDNAVGDLINGLHVTIDDKGCLFPTFDDPELTAGQTVALIGRRALEGNPVRYEKSTMYDRLLADGRIVMCLAPVLGSLDIPTGRYGSRSAIYMNPEPPVAVEEVIFDEEELHAILVRDAFDSVGA